MASNDHDHGKFTNFENLFSPEQFNQKFDESFLGKKGYIDSNEGLQSKKR